MALDLFKADLILSGMKLETRMKENWLTQKPLHNGMNLTLGMVFLLMLTTLFFLQDFFHLNSLMSVSYAEVFEKHEYWRLWTSLLVHADVVHLFSNLVLFVPFSYMLGTYFSPYFFPLIAFFLGGPLNALVILGMDKNASLLGSSGVVHWMGAAWLTLSYLIDRRQGKVRRVLKFIGISLILFIPESYRPEVSYMSHFLGYFIGVMSGFTLYLINHKLYESKAREEYVFTDYWPVEGTGHRL